MKRDCPQSTNSGSSFGRKRSGGSGYDSDSSASGNKFKAARQFNSGQNHSFGKKKFPAKPKSIMRKTKDTRGSSSQSGGEWPRRNGAFIDAGDSVNFIFEDLAMDGAGRALFELALAGTINYIENGVH